MCATPTRVTVSAKTPSAIDASRGRAYNLRKRTKNRDAEDAMRNLPVSIVLAVACLLVVGAGTLLAADHDVDSCGLGILDDVDSYGLGILSADTSCPAATHSLRTCPEYPTEVYLSFDAQRGKTNRFEGYYVVAFGKVDLVSCAPLPLIHVVRIEEPVVIPFCW